MLFIEEEQGTLFAKEEGLKKLAFSVEIVFLGGQGIGEREPEWSTAG